MTSQERQQLTRHVSQQTQQRLAEIRQQRENERRQFFATNRQLRIQEARHAGVETVETRTTS